MDAMPLFGKEMKEKEFPLTEGVTFINHGSYGVVPRRIKEAQRKIIDEMDSSPDLWFRRNRRIKQDEARHCIAEFVHADPDDLVFVQNTTSGVNTVLKSMKLKPEDIILYNDNTYRAVINTCEATAQFSCIAGVRTDLLTLQFPINSEDEVVEMYREYFKKQPNVKVAVLDHITSQSAIRMPLEKLIPLCKEYGIMTLIDGAHAPGQIPLNLKELDADFYSGNLHKWLYTPRGCAILYVKKEHQDWVRPIVTSHGYKTTFQNDFFKQGTRDDSPYCVVPEAIQFYKDLGGYEKIRDYTDDLLNTSTELLSSSWKTEKLQIPKSMEAPFMRLVRLPELKQTSMNSIDDGERRIVEIIINYGIVPCITFVDGKVYCRLSANVYNTKDDYKILCDLVLKMIDK
ncbi:Hypothetical predicted protein [Mytilus galloprovincialis]|uniref:Aminotransferase class V domain-containing protein n=1 Tax=Mytilus galloprovincialis TaxID=29158 RepID=A0A8B6FPB8_MYTGA|nr:Hypothetical predicted protein [Mytilus galloprovincialis]